MVCGVTVGCSDDVVPGGVGDRWVPDDSMVVEVLCSPRSFLRMTGLSAADRAWLVAGLSVRGLTAEEIAARTHCSLRLVRTIRSWEMTAVCEWVHSRVVVLEGEVSAARSSGVFLSGELGVARREVARVRGQVDQLVAKLSAGEKVGVFRCGHLRVDWNVYVQRGVDGKGVGFSREFCRECNNARASRYRERRKAQANSGDHTSCVTDLRAVVVS